MPIASAARLFIGVSSLLLLALETPAPAVPIAISSSLDWTARAIQGAVTSIDNDTDSQGATLGPLAVNVLADTGGAQHTRAEASVAAAFLNVAAGQVQFDGSLLLQNLSAPQTGSNEYLLPSVFSYEFVADTDGDVRISGIGQSTLQLRGTPLGTDPFSLQASLDGAGPANLDGTGGVVTFNITQGQTHTLRIGMINFSPGQAGNSNGLELAMSTTVDWDFDAIVPEPAGLTMLSTALLALVGLGTRRRLVDVILSARFFQRPATSLRS